MNAIKGIYKEGRIEPIQPIPVKENYMVKITFLRPMDSYNKEQYHFNDNDFLAVSESSIDFWLNDKDDMVWNNV